HASRECYVYPSRSYHRPSMPTPPPGPPDAGIRENLLYSCSFALAALAAECVIAAAFLSHVLILAVCLHLLVTSILLLAAWHAPGRFALLLAIMTAAIGPYGAAICLLACVIYAFRARKISSPEQWMEAFFSQDDLTESNQLHERLSLGLTSPPATSAVEPF